MAEADEGIFNNSWLVEEFTSMQAATRRSLEYGAFALFVGSQ
jgi:hypothetical protein